MTSTFHQRAVAVIKRIPKGRVATYGQVAAMAGNPRAARQITRVLNSSSKKERLPWQRVINREGRISLRPGEGYEQQKGMLLDEGVRFDRDDRIDLARFGWKPRVRGTTGSCR